MDEFSDSRKRDRTSYLDDFYEELMRIEEAAKKKKPNNVFDSDSDSENVPGLKENKEEKGQDNIFDSDSESESNFNTNKNKQENGDFVTNRDSGAMSIIKEAGNQQVISNGTTSNHVKEKNHANENTVVNDNYSVVMSIIEEKEKEQEPGYADNNYGHFFIKETENEQELDTISTDDDNPESISIMKQKEILKDYEHVITNNLDFEIPCKIKEKKMLEKEKDLVTKENISQTSITTHKEKSQENENDITKTVDDEIMALIKEREMLEMPGSESVTNAGDLDFMSIIKTNNVPKEQENINVDPSSKDKTKIKQNTNLKEHKNIPTKNKELESNKNNKKKKEKGSKTTAAPIATDEVYIIECLREKKGNKYLVKWENYPEKDKTWEPKATIPPLILKFYEDDLTRLGTPVPDSLLADELNTEYPDEFTVEALVEKKGSKYLVKWENYPSDQNTWEPRSSIPDFILKYYEQDLSRLGQVAPSPTKKKTEEPKKEAPKKTKKKTETKSDAFDEIYYSDDMFDEIMTESNDEDSEVVSNVKTKEKKKGTGKKTSQAPEDGIYIIESLKEKKGNKYLVKWENFSEKHNTWESRENINCLILKYYEHDLTRLGGPVPDTLLDGEASEVFAEEYTIESLVEKKGSKYLVKWENYPSEQNTWEPRSSIPKFILKYYEESLARLGQPAPSPTKQQQTANNKHQTANNKQQTAKKAKQPKKEATVKNKKITKKKEKINKSKDEKPTFNAAEKLQTIRRSLEEFYINEEIDISESNDEKPKSKKKNTEKYEVMTTKHGDKDTRNDDHENECNDDGECVIVYSSPKISTQRKKKRKHEDYIIESLVKKKGTNYLVKWGDCPSEENSWEPRSNIPAFILKYFEEDLSRLGMPAPTEDDELEENEEYAETEIEVLLDTRPDKPVEFILDTRISNTGEAEYLVKWKGFNRPDDNTWEKIDNIKKYKFLVDAFEKKVWLMFMRMKALEKIKRKEAEEYERKKSEGKGQKQKNKRSESIAEKPIDNTAENIQFYSRETKDNIRGKKKDRIITKTPENVKRRLFSLDERTTKIIENVKGKPKERRPTVDERTPKKMVTVKEKPKDKTPLKAPEETKIIESLVEKAGYICSIAEKVKRKKKEKDSTDANEETYNIESLVKKKGSKYLVKWENFSDKWNTWEPKSSIPQFILKYYEEDPSRLGTTAPADPDEVLVDTEEEPQYEVERV